MASGRKGFNQGSDMIILDGSEGKGGAQILRSALSLSMATGQPFRMYNIRASRKKPGLLRQHLTCVRAAARIWSAQVEGAELGSPRLTFKPGPIVPGEYAFAVGSAGSSILVFQTVMPALITTGQSFALTLEGGTHNPAAPPLESTWVPSLGSAFGPRSPWNDADSIRQGEASGGSKWPRRGNIRLCICWNAALRARIPPRCCGTASRPTNLSGLARI